MADPSDKPSTVDMGRVRNFVFVRRRVEAMLASAAVSAHGLHHTYRRITRDEFVRMATRVFDREHDAHEAELRAEAAITQDHLDEEQSEFAVATTNPKQENEK